MTPPRLRGVALAERIGIADVAAPLLLVEFEDGPPLPEGLPYSIGYQVPDHVAVTVPVRLHCLMTKLAFSSFTRRPQSALMPLRV